MNKLFKKRILFPIIGAIALVFSLAMFFINSPKTEAAGSKTVDSLTIAQMYANKDTGKCGNFSWNPSDLKSITSSGFTYEYWTNNKHAFKIVWTKPSDMAYPSKLNYGYSIADGVNKDSASKNFNSDETTKPSLPMGGDGRRQYTVAESTLYSNYDKIVFWLGFSYTTGDLNVTSITFEIKTATAAVKGTAGTGVKSVFFSTSSDAKSGSASGTEFEKGKTVYGYAVLKEGYKAQNSWTFIDGTANSENSIYRVAEKKLESTDFDFGTINAIAKTASIYRYGNGGSNLGNKSLTYGSSAELGTPTRTGYEFKGWNTEQNGTGNTISSSLTAEEVNTIIDAGTPTSVYAQWSINAAGVDGFIENIGQVSYTSDSKSRIDAAREAYNSLDSEEQASVTKYATLTAAEATYAKLKADNEAADAVEELIGNIGQVSYTSDSKSRIDTARAAYDSLTADQKALVTNYNVLTAAEATYAKLKADNEAADAVDVLIDAIGTVEYTDASKGRIDAAREAYDALTADQKALVTNYSTLTTAETTYKNLDDNAKANAVDSLISAIGKVEYTTTCKTKIGAAREAYDALTADQKALVTNYSTLTDAETEYNNQKVTGANNVKNMIDAIPSEVDYDDEECVNKIFEAREAYDALTEEQQALVDNYAKLTAAEATYKELDDHAKANVIIGLINDIDEVAYPTSKGVIDVAREAYDALTADQKALVTNYSTLTDAETEYAKLKADNEAANAVDALISAIGKVEYTTTCKTKIDAARTAYDALTADQKALVTNYSALTDAEKRYDELELAATRHSLDDKEKGVEIETSDGTGIPKTITLKVEVKTTVSATDGSTAQANINAKLNNNEVISGVYDVKLIQTINGVEKVVQPSDIKAGTKIKIHITIPEGVNPEETRILHIHSENDIEYVENVEVVGNEFVFEVDRLSEFALVTLTHGIPGWAIALIVIGCVLLLCCVCYLLLFFVFNKWINKDGKAVRVFKLGKKDDKVRVIIMPCKFEYKEESEVFKTKEEAMK